MFFVVPNESVMMAEVLWHCIVDRICLGKAALNAGSKQQSVLNRFLESNNDNVLYILLNGTKRDDPSQWQMSISASTFDSNMDNDLIGMAVIKNHAGSIQNDMMTNESVSHLFTFVESSNICMFWDQCRILVNQWFIPELQQLCFIHLIVCNSIDN